MKRPRSHQAGDLAENLVASAFLKQGWIVNPCNVDYGFDFLVQHLPSDGEGPCFAFLQVKGTDRSLPTRRGEKFGFRFSVDHLTYWGATPMPVYICVVCLEREQIFVVNADEVVRALVSRLGSAWNTAISRTVQISTESVWDGRRAEEVLGSVIRQWNSLRSLWGSAAAAESMGKSLYVSWLSGCLNLTHAVGIQHHLSDSLGGRDAAQALLKEAGLPWLRMP